MEQKKLKLLFLTGSRGEWGYIRPILRLIDQSEDFEYSLAVTNMHLLPSFGQAENEIVADGFEIKHRLYMALDGYNHVSMVKSIGVLLCSMADILANEKPDWIILAGDRGEQMTGALAGAFSYVPVAHIQAGERSGNIDGMTRHAIGKYAHLHFAANQDAADRLTKLGEQEFRVHNVGAPQLDELRTGEITPLEELADRFGIDLSSPYLLFVQHPVTEDFERAEEQVEIALKALQKIELPKIAILPNNDAGSQSIREGISKFRTGRFDVFANLARRDYLGLLKNASCIVGNSSSGLLEAPTFATPAVNIGRRQADRVQGANVINSSFDEGNIVACIQKALSDDFQNQLRENCVNPYGDGHSSERILNLLKGTRVDDALLVKRLTY